ncbi:MAG TPA: PAS domain S-box protein [Syntrophales bacterium]|nr:PAS domain S-box protein [Syntrophales bacterium]
MNNEPKAVKRPPDKLAALRREIAELRKSEAGYKQTVEALQKSEAYFRAITQYSSDIIIVVNKMGKITYVNPSIERFMGYKPEELIGKSGFDFIMLTDLPRAIYDFGKAILTKDIIIPNAFRVRHKDGSEHVLEGVGNNLLDDPAVAGFVMNVRDITKRKHAEEELRKHREHLEELVEERTTELKAANEQLQREITERKQISMELQKSEQQYRMTIDSMGDIIHVVDRDMRIILANEAIKEWARVMPVKADILGLKVFEAFPFLPVKVQEEYEQVFRTGKPMISEECTVLEGKEVYTETRKIPVMKGASVAQVITIIRDITDRKKVECERERLEERLHRAEKMEALGTLAGGVAHDLNNVLGVLVGYSELLLEKVPEGSPLRNYVASIFQSSQKGTTIIQDLLTLARRGVAVSEVINLNAIVTGYFKTPEFERLKAYHPYVTFKTDLGDDLLNVKGSPVHLGKTIMNLLSNASEAISDRGEVMIRTENRYIDKPIRGYHHVREGDYVVLTVTDNGKGISSDDIKKIFEPFYTKKVMGRSGTGLGLAVVWGTVKDHDGYINVESEDGKGSKFTIYLPATREKLTGDQQKIPHEQYMGKGESILVVDDVKEQRDVATSMLTRLGYKVHSVASGEEAITYLRTKKVDLIVLDMIMDPGIDGLETYRRILEINPKQKAVIVSGFSETDRVKRAQELGAGTYVRKPYILEKIGMAIRRELDEP